MNFWLTFRKANLDLTKWWQFLREAKAKEKGATFCEIPSFLIDNLPVTDSSFIATEFRVTLPSTTKFSLRFFPFKQPSFATNFCLAIRTPINDGDGLNVTRYKLWSNVGEILYFPLYTGQVIQGPFAFEIWTTGHAKVELDLPFDIILSLLADPGEIAFCCQPNTNQLIVTPWCELFVNKNSSANYSLPLVFQYCNGEGPQPTDIGIITEDATAKITVETQTPLRVE